MEGIIWAFVIEATLVILAGLAIIAMSGCRANEQRPGFEIGNGYYVSNLTIREMK
ncbi:MAG: hypothetical protein IPP74_14745 [Alphaproteobacteria bacterium]|nr:hypothetical protein [Alphaproteobacteria bacterium]